MIVIIMQVKTFYYLQLFRLANYFKVTLLSVPLSSTNISHTFLAQLLAAQKTRIARIELA